jgi:hypothetical protein
LMRFMLRDISGFLSTLSTMWRVPRVGPLWGSLGGILGDLMPVDISLYSV